MRLARGAEVACLQRLAHVLAGVQVIDFHGGLRRWQVREFNRSNHEVIFAPRGISFTDRYPRLRLARIWMWPEATVPERENSHWRHGMPLRLYTLVTFFWRPLGLEDEPAGVEPFNAWTWRDCDTRRYVLNFDIDQPLSLPGNGCNLWHDLVLRHDSKVAIFVFHSSGRREYTTQEIKAIQETLRSLTELSCAHVRPLIQVVGADKIPPEAFPLPELFLVDNGPPSQATSLEEELAASGTVTWGTLAHVTPEEWPLLTRDSCYLPKAWERPEQAGPLPACLTIPARREEHECDYEEPTMWDSVRRTISDVRDSLSSVFYPCIRR
jgi:hypothetical protein